MCVGLILVTFSHVGKRVGMLTPSSQGNQKALARAAGELRRAVRTAALPPLRVTRLLDQVRERRKSPGFVERERGGLASATPTTPQRRHAAPAVGPVEGGEKRSGGVGARQRASLTDSPPLSERSEPQVSAASSAARPRREHRSAVGPWGRPSDRPRGQACTAAWRAQATSRPHTARIAAD